MYSSSKSSESWSFLIADYEMDLPVGTDLIDAGTELVDVELRTSTGVELTA